MQARLEALDRRVAATLDDETMPVFEEVRAEWLQRMAQCSGDNCRQNLVEDRIERLRYGLGETSRGVAGLPWRHGAFELRARYRLGYVQIYPLIDDRLLVVIGGVEQPRGRWICAASAVGRSTGRGPYRLRLLIEEPLEPGPLELQIEPRGLTRLSVDYDFHERYACGLNGRVDGIYRLETSGRVRGRR